MTPEEPATAPADHAAAADTPAAPTPSSIPSPAPESSPTMHEVHPFHGPARGWKDFLIHIATISVGLLIAIALEQLVVYAHHRLQLRSTRAELATELADNEGQLARNQAWLRTLAAELEADMTLLRAAQRPDGNALKFSSTPWWPVDGPWQAAKQGGALELMPHFELDRYVYLHEAIQAVMDAFPPLVLQLEQARAIAHRSPDGALSARDVEELISAISDAQARVAYGDRLLNYEAQGIKIVRALRD